MAEIDRRRVLKYLLAPTPFIASPSLFSNELVAATRGLFGRTERRVPGLKKFPKWKGALDRYFSEEEKLKGACSTQGKTNCALADWNDFVGSIRGQKIAPSKVLNIVNKHLNKKKYVLDSINWNQKDYWASPGEFERKSGDCEDYGIAKFMTLRALGFDPNSMRVVVVTDMNLKIAHALLAVKMDGDELILDNQIQSVISHKRIRHYKPIYAVNEKSWWLFR